MMRMPQRKSSAGREHSPRHSQQDDTKCSESGYFAMSDSGYNSSSRSTSARRTVSAFSRYSSMSVSSTMPFPMAHIGFQGSRHLHPERLPSAKREKLVSLRVIDQDYEMIENIQKIANSLKRLDMSNIGIDNVEEDVLQNLEKLESLDLSHNDLTEDSLPAVLTSLHRLTDLRLNNNIFTQVPKVLKKLKSLTRLYIGVNQITDVKDTFERLKKLTTLVCNNNHLISIINEICTLRRLEVLDASNNEIIEIPKCVKDFKVLKEINMSHNHLVSLPIEIFLLPKLDALDVSCNQIQRIPSVNIKGKVKRLIPFLDISQNQLVRFPEHLLLMVDHLDVSSNKIRKITGTIFKKMKIRSDMTLHLENNPIIFPPREICESGIWALVQYFTEVKTTSKVYQGLKVIVFGTQGSGKTSLIQTLIDQQPRLTDDEDRTVGMDSYWTQMDLDDLVDADTASVSSHTSTSSGSSCMLNLTLWDMSGNPFYKLPHHDFLEQPYLGILVFDMADYTSDKFTEVLSDWMDWVLSKTNKVFLVIVGAKQDKVKLQKGESRDEKVRHICKDVAKAAKRYVHDYKEQIRGDITAIENMPSISKSLTEQLQSDRLVLKSLEIIIYPEVVSVSSLDMKGFGQLQKAIYSMSMNKDHFPTVMKPIPSLWVNVEEYIEDRGNEMQMPLMYWDKFEEEITEKFGMRHLLPNITIYLHEMGKVLWFCQHPILKNYVFLRPSWFMENEN